MTIDWKTVIPKKFYNGDKHPKARTVGELAALLAELPQSLKLRTSFQKPAELIVYNINNNSRHLQITEPFE